MSAVICNSAEQLAGVFDHRIDRSAGHPNSPAQYRQARRDSWEMGKAMREVWGKCLSISDCRDDFSRDDYATGA